MDILALVAAALVISVCYGAITLALLINFDVVPRPEPGQIAAWLDWHRSPRVHFLRTENPAWTATTPASTGFVPTFAVAVMVWIPLAIGDVKPDSELTTPGNSAGTGTPAFVVQLTA